MNLENTNKLVINKKTCEELFLLCYKGDEMARIIIKRMAKKKRAEGTIVMQISAFATFSQNANARILSKPVFIRGYSWRILSIRYHLTGYWLLVRDFFVLRFIDSCPIPLIILLKTTANARILSSMSKRQITCRLELHSQRRVNHQVA